MGGGGGAVSMPTVRTRTSGPSGFAGLVQNAKIFGLALFASVGGLLYGYNQGVFSQVQIMSDFHSRFASTLDVSGKKSTLTAILEFGAFIGALSNGYIADRFSRKYSIAAWCIIFCVGTAVQVAAQTNVANIFAGRFVVGLAVGGISMVVPMYNAELAPPEIRGSLVALQQFSITIGIMVSYWIAYGTNFIGGTGVGQSSAAWRVPIALQIVPALFLGIGALFLPFSPRWLMIRGREDDSLMTLSKLRNLPPADDVVQLEFLELQAERLTELEALKERYGQEEPNFKITCQEYLRLFCTLSLLHRLSIACLVQLFQQFSGINAIIYYAPTIFEGVGLSGSTIPLLATGLVGVVNVIFTIPAVLYVDRLGRKTLLFWGALGMFACHIIIAGIVGSFGGRFDQNPAPGYVAVVFVYIYICFFASTWGPVAWIVGSEVFPLGVRAKGLSISTATNWISNYVIATITPPMITNIRWGTYLFFGLMCLSAAIYVFFFVPETKGRTLEEIDAIFKDNEGQEDMIRRDRIARQIGLDKFYVNELEHVEKTGTKEARDIV